MGQCRVSWAQFSNMSIELSDLIKKQNGRYAATDGVYGIQTGGLFVAQEVAKHLQLPLVDKPRPSSLIIGDSVENETVLSQYDKNLTAALHVKPEVVVKPKVYLEETKDAIIYPWQEQRPAVEDCVVKILEFLNEDPSRQGLLDTPRRVVKSWDRLFSGYRIDPLSVLATQFDEAGSDGIVVCRDIEMYSTCEHHMLPFIGHASVGYIPRNGRIVGLSKLARIVEVFSRRLQNQERITRQVADALQEALNPLAVGVVIQAEHFCMRARGVEKQNSKMVTSHFLGTFREDYRAREEFMKMVGR